MGIRHRIEEQIRSWPVYRQLAGTDRLGRGEAAKSRASGRLAPRTDTAGASLAEALAAIRSNTLASGRLTGLFASG